MDINKTYYVFAFLTLLFVAPQLSPADRVGSGGAGTGAGAGSQAQAEIAEELRKAGEELRSLNETREQRTLSFKTTIEENIAILRDLFGNARDIISNPQIVKKGQMHYLVDRLCSCTDPRCASRCDCTGCRDAYFSAFRNEQSQQAERYRRERSIPYADTGFAGKLESELANPSSSYQVKTASLMWPYGSDAYRTNHITLKHPAEKNFLDTLPAKIREHTATIIDAFDRILTINASGSDDRFLHSLIGHIESLQNVILPKASRDLASQQYSTIPERAIDETCRAILTMINQKIQAAKTTKLVDLEKSHDKDRIDLQRRIEQLSAQRSILMQTALQRDANQLALKIKELEAESLSRKHDLAIALQEKKQRDAEALESARAENKRLAQAELAAIEEKKQRDAEALESVKAENKRLARAELAAIEEKKAQFAQDQAKLEAQLQMTQTESKNAQAQRKADLKKEVLRLEEQLQTSKSREQKEIIQAEKMAQEAADKRAQDLSALQHRQALEIEAQKLKAIEALSKAEILKIEAQTKQEKETAKEREELAVALAKAKEQQEIEKHKLTMAAATEQTKIVETTKHKAIEAMQKNIRWGLIGTPLGAAAVIAAYYGFKHYYIKRPVIIEETDTSIGTKPLPSHLDEVVLNEKLTEQIMVPFNMTINALKEGYPAPSFIFHGPPGTGKTMTAIAFVRRLKEMGLADYVVVRGPAFKRLGSAHAAQEALASIFRWALKKSKLPVGFVFDEMETWLTRRGSKYATEMSNDLLTTLLGFLEKSFNLKFFIIGLSNHLEEVDPAFVNRSAYTVRIGAPGSTEIEKIFNLNLKKYLLNNNFKVHESVYSALPDLAKNATGLVGREIDGVIQKAAYSLLGTKDKELTGDILKKHIENTVRQHNETVAHMEK